MSGVMDWSARCAEMIELVGLTTEERQLIKQSSPMIMAHVREINDWVYNTATGRASSGTIEVTFNNGDSVLITATGTGYTVAVTIGGSTTNYTVTFT